MNKNILQELNICDVTKLELKEFQAEGYFDALHDLVDLIEIRDFSFKNSYEQRKFYESINSLQEKTKESRLTKMIAERLEMKN